MEPEGKADEICIQTNCQANDLGNQLEKLTVDEAQAEITIPEPEPVEEVVHKNEGVHQEEAFHHEEAVHKVEVVEPDVAHQPQIEESVSQAEEVQPHIQQV